MAGFIHHVEGDVKLNGKAISPKPDEFLHVQEGQRLSTGDGRAEIMLVPESYLRLGADSEIEMVNSGLTAARLRLVHGRAVLDLPVIFDRESIVLVTPGAELRVQKTGLYEASAPAQGGERIQVFSGRATVAVNGEELTLKSKETVAIHPELSEQAIEKFDSKERDSLLAWSGSRSAKLERTIADARRKSQESLSSAERLLLEMTLRRPVPTRQPQPQRPSPPPSGTQRSGGGSRP